VISGDALVLVKTRIRVNVSIISDPSFFTLAFKPISDQIITLCVRRTDGGDRVSVGINALVNILAHLIILGISVIARAVVKSVEIFAVSVGITASIRVVTFVIICAGNSVSRESKIASTFEGAISVRALGISVAVMRLVYAGALVNIITIIAIGCITNVASARVSLSIIFVLTSSLSRNKMAREGSVTGALVRVNTR